MGEKIAETIISILWQLLLGDSKFFLYHFLCHSKFFLYHVPTDYKLLLLILT